MVDHDHPLFRVFSVVAGMVVIALGFLSIAKSDHVLMLMVGLCLFVVGAAVLAVPVAEVVVEWFSRLFGELFFSDNQIRGPQPIYSIPEARRARGDLQGAWEALEKIAADFANEFKVYTQMMDMAVMDSADLSLAEKVLARGLRALKKSSDREALQHAHALMVERFHTREERSRNLQSLDGRNPDSGL